MAEKKKTREETTHVQWESIYKVAPKALLDFLKSITRVKGIKEFITPVVIKATFGTYIWNEFKFSDDYILPAVDYLEKKGIIVDVYWNPEANLFFARVYASTEKVGTISHLGRFESRYDGYQAAFEEAFSVLEKTVFVD